MEKQESSKIHIDDLNTQSSIKTYQSNGFEH